MEHIEHPKEGGSGLHAPASRQVLPEVPVKSDIIERTPAHDQQHISRLRDVILDSINDHIVKTDLTDRVLREFVQKIDKIISIVCICITIIGIATLTATTIVLIALISHADLVLGPPFGAIEPLWAIAGLGGLTVTVNLASRPLRHRKTRNRDRNNTVFISGSDNSPEE